MKKSTMKENMRIIAKGMPILLNKMWRKIRKPLFALAAFACFFVILILTAGVENNNADLAAYVVKGIILMGFALVFVFASGYWKE